MKKKNSISETGCLKTNSGGAARPFLPPYGRFLNAMSLGSGKSAMQAMSRLERTRDFLTTFINHK
jgi:hypothetical protein